MRIIAAILLTLISAVGIGSVMAQTPEPPPGMNSSVVVTLITSGNGTNDNLLLELSGTFPGDPLALTLDQPGDLQPGGVDIYNFIVPHTYCEMFQFRLSLLGSDDWQGQQIAIQIDGAQVYYNSAFSDGGALTSTSWRGGTWDGTAAYRDHCATTPVNVNLVTGPDGTNDNPYFYLEGDFSASPYLVYMDQAGDLQPGNSDIYNLTVPMDFCQMTGWRLSKGGDDAWLPTLISIDVESTQVYYDAAFYEVGPITASSNVWGTWDGTAAYQDHCGLVFNPGVIAVLPTATPLVLNPGVIRPLETVAPTLVRINPDLVQPFATATPFPMDVGNLQLRPTETPFPRVVGGLQLLPTATPPSIPGGVVIVPTLAQPAATATPVISATTCIGAPPPRLSVGGMGRVTPGAPNRIRSEPSTAGLILGQIPPGGVFSVIDGPRCDGTYAWWQINYNGIVGWTAEGTGSDYFVEPV